MKKDIVQLQTSNTATKVRLTRSLINDANDHIFSVYFKKLDGSLREMVCRRHVTKGVKGTAKYDIEKVDREHNQITVYDMQVCGYRKINLDTVSRLKVDGTIYSFDTLVNPTPKPHEFALWPMIQEFIDNITPEPPKELPKEPQTVIHIHLGPGSTIKI